MREPDQKTPHGRAWQIDLSKARECPEKAGMVACWLINVPGAHPFWSYWTISVLALRDLPGVKPAYKKYPEAEYEFMIITVDPEACPEPDPDVIAANGHPFLTPVDVVEQFHGITDADASRIAEGAVRAILLGSISPDQDFRPYWQNLIAGTVKHFVEGKHPSTEVGVDPGDGQTQGLQTHPRQWGSLAGSGVRTAPTGVQLDGRH